VWVVVYSWAEVVCWLVPQLTCCLTWFLIPEGLLLKTYSHNCTAQKHCTQKYIVLLSDWTWSSRDASFAFQLLKSRSVCEWFHTSTRNGKRLSSYSSNESRNLGPFSFFLFCLEACVFVVVIFLLLAVGVKEGNEFHDWGQVCLFLSFSLSIYPCTAGCGNEEEGLKSWRVENKGGEEGGGYQGFFPFSSQNDNSAGLNYHQRKEKKHQQKLSISYLQLCFLRFPSIHWDYHRIGLHSLFLSNWFVTQKPSSYTSDECAPAAKGFSLYFFLHSKRCQSFVITPVLSE